MSSGCSIEIMELLSQVNRAGTTIVQVTHDEKVAAFGRRVIELRDGMLVEDRPVF